MFEADDDRTNNATIEVIIEARGFNNSLAGAQNCPNAPKNRQGDQALQIWVSNYLQNGTLKHTVRRHCADSPKRPRDSRN